MTKLQKGYTVIKIKEDSKCIAIPLCELKNIPSVYLRFGSCYPNFKDAHKTANSLNKNFE